MLLLSQLQLFRTMKNKRKKEGLCPGVEHLCVRMLQLLTLDLPQEVHTGWYPRVLSIIRAEVVYLAK